MGKYLFFIDDDDSRIIKKEEESIAFCWFQGKNGGVSIEHYKNEVPPIQVVDTIKLFEVPSWKNKSFLHQKYVSEGLSLAQIASEVTSSRSTVRKELERFKIDVRPKSHHNGNPSQVKFGQRVVKGKLIEHKAEKRAIDSIFRMREEGLGYRAIARCLDDLKIPTKNRGKKWHPEMVRRILNDSINLN